MAGVGLFLITSAVGRAWCGYACPQTVWTDLFQHVDRFIDGDRNAQMRLNAAPWGPGKTARRALKWSIYLGIAFWTGGAWIMYFADVPTLTRQFWSGQAAPVAYATVAVLTFTTFWLGGFMREQVCIYMCPWPRIQSAMLDEKSLLVTYKDWRGEPRGKAAKGAPKALGDCIDCGLCTAVCPTGVDIREGSQIGCITCALCIDACDRVMGQLGRPRGLIDYATLEDSEREKQGKAPTPHHKLIWHPRTLVYFGVWSAIGLTMLFLLGTRQHLALNVAKDRNPPYMLLSGGEVRNAYTLKLRNMEGRPRRIRVGLEGVPGGAMWTDDTSRASAARVLTVAAAADQTTPLRVYVAAPAGTMPQPLEFELEALDSEHGHASYKTRFDAPGGDESHDEEHD
jgi:cytochrome c oxidase accessory protein FixG